jgi:hypothetical protein
MDDRERIFFQHDVATPLSNLRGAQYLLKMGLPDPGETVVEALDVLSHGIHQMERMLYWYWETREMERGVDPSEPWPVSDLPGRLEATARESSVPLEPISVGETLPGWAEVPPDPFVAGLLGAAVTLTSASGCVPEWALAEVRGVLRVSLSVPGDRFALDPSRLIRKYFWPGSESSTHGFDSGLPYLDALLRPFAGELEMVWRKEGWTLLVTLPLSPNGG